MTGHASILTLLYSNLWPCVTAGKVLEAWFVCTRTGGQGWRVDRDGCKWWDWELTHQNYSGKNEYLILITWGDTDMNNDNVTLFTSPTHPLTHLFNCARELTQAMKWLALMVLTSLNTILTAPSRCVYTPPDQKHVHTQPPLLHIPSSRVCLNCIFICFMHIYNTYPIIERIDFARREFPQTCALAPFHWQKVGAWYRFGIA